MIARVRAVLLPPGVDFGLGEGLTLMLTYFSAGLAVSVLHVTEGTDPLVVVAAAVIVNSATSTLAYAAVTSSGGSTLAGVLSGWLVATRFGLFAAALAPRLWPERWRRALSAHLAFDPSTALAQNENTDLASRSTFVAAGLWLCLPWWVAAGIGASIGQRLGDTDALGLDAVLPAMLLAIAWNQLREGWPVAVVAAVVALLMAPVAPAGVPVLAATLAALLALRNPPAKPAERSTVAC